MPLKSLCLVLGVCRGLRRQRDDPVFDVSPEGYDCVVAFRAYGRAISRLSVNKISSDIQQRGAYICAELKWIYHLSATPSRQFRNSILFIRPVADFYSLLDDFPLRACHPTKLKVCGTSLAADGVGRLGWRMDSISGSSWFRSVSSRVTPSKPHYLPSPSPPPAPPSLPYPPFLSSSVSRNLALVRNLASMSNVHTNHTVTTDCTERQL